MRKILEMKIRLDRIFYCVVAVLVLVGTQGIVGCGQAKSAAKDKIKEGIEDAVESRLSSLEELLFTGGTNRLVENLVALTQPSLRQGENANAGRGRMVATDNADFENCEYSVIQLTWSCSAANTTSTSFTTNTGGTISLSSNYQGTVIIQFEASDETKLPQSLQSAATINRALLTADGAVTSTLTSSLLNDGQGFSVTLTLSETTVTLTDIQETQFDFALQATATAQTSVGSQERTLGATLTGSGQATRATDSVTITTGNFTLTLQVEQDAYTFQMIVNDGTSTITALLNGEEQSSHEFEK